MVRIVTLLDIKIKKDAKTIKPFKMGGKSTKQNPGNFPDFQCSICLENTTENLKLAKCNCTFCTEVILIQLIPYFYLESYLFSVFVSFCDPWNQQWENQDWMSRNQLQKRWNQSWGGEENRQWGALSKVYQIYHSQIGVFEQELEMVSKTRLQYYLQGAKQIFSFQNYLSKMPGRILLKMQSKLDWTS